MVFENGVKNIQAAAYNGVRTVFKFLCLLTKGHFFEGIAVSENIGIKNQVLRLIFIKLRLRNSMIKFGLLTPQNLYSILWKHSGKRFTAFLA